MKYRILCEFFSVTKLELSTQALASELQFTDFDSELSGATKLLHLTVECQQNFYKTFHNDN